MEVGDQFIPELLVNSWMKREFEDCCIVFEVLTAV
jgi:hypothetical protein